MQRLGLVAAWGVVGVCSCMRVDVPRPRRPPAVWSRLHILSAKAEGSNEDWRDESVWTDDAQSWMAASTWESTTPTRDTSDAATDSEEDEVGPGPELSVGLCFSMAIYRKFSCSARSLIYPVIVGRGRRIGINGNVLGE